ncbi:MAG: hypothetical protein EA376_09315 [Phycisphaeraceae bacterium]|nr:MAG: hypothetical protein EA376_09315 [Phycisphaeraceae bacterium]
MSSIARSLATGCALSGLLACSTTYAQVANLRITEVSPSGNMVEILNTGPAFTTGSNHPFCHRFNYQSVIPSGTSFDAGERRVFAVTSLNNTDSDLWLYSQTPFNQAANIVHGLKYGPQANVGRTGLASTAGLWPSGAAFTASPPAGMTLVWEEFGFTPVDWFTNELPSLGAPFMTNAGSIPSSLEYPGGLQDFESVPLGQEVEAIDGWFIVNSSDPGRFSVRVVNDAQGVVGPRPGSTSTRWLRIRDRDPGDVQNRFYSLPIVAPAEEDYTWTFYVNLETTPPGGSAVKPRLTIQHVGDSGFTNAWGVEFDDAGANLVVTGIGGPDASTSLYPLSGATAIGQWVRIELALSFGAMEVSASVNGDSPVSLPIDPDPDFGPTLLRFCYRGEGMGNEMVMLLDDVSIEFNGAGAPCPCDLTGSGSVGGGDLATLLGCWGSTSSACESAFDCGGTTMIGASNLATLLGNWGPCP